MTVSISHFKNQVQELPLYSRCLVLTDACLEKSWGQELLNALEERKIPANVIALNSQETIKNPQTCVEIWEKLHTWGFDRSSCIIGMGGGVITDIAGFIASTYMRGIDLILVPTTLLGMVDAALGGKNGVNLPTGKNIVGTIYEPSQLWMRFEFLNTLPEREFRSGLAEVIKHAIIDGADFFNWLNDNMEAILKREEWALEKIIRTSYEIKTKITQEDLEENDTRVLLNFGHTFAHALETITAYSKFTHGEAVSIGMSAAMRTSYELGLTDKATVAEVDRLIVKAGLPIEMPAVPFDRLIDLMAKDKKAGFGKIILICASKIGKVSKVPDVDRHTILRALQAKREN